MVPKNSRNCREGLLHPHEQFRRVFPRATATGGAWVHAPPRESAATGGIGFFHSSFRRRRSPAK